MYRLITVATLALVGVKGGFWASHASYMKETQDCLNVITADHLAEALPKIRAAAKDEIDW